MYNIAYTSAIYIQLLYDLRSEFVLFFEISPFKSKSYKNVYNTRTTICTRYTYIVHEASDVQFSSSEITRHRYPLRKYTYFVQVEWISSSQDQEPASEDCNRRTSLQTSLGALLQTHIILYIRIKTIYTYYSHTCLYIYILCMVTFANTYIALYTQCGFRPDTCVVIVCSPLGDALRFFRIGSSFYDYKKFIESLVKLFGHSCKNSTYNDYLERY